MNDRNKQIQKGSQQRELQHQVVAASFCGPIPPPAVLEGYKLISPDFPERIMKMAEEQAAHRRELEKEVIHSQLKQSDRGQHYGFVVALVFAFVALVLGMNGHEILAGIIGGIDLIGLVALFITGKIQQKNNLEEKNPPQ